MKDNTIGISSRQTGTDLRYIQELIGHKSSKTTEIYTHVSKGNLAYIRNPLDNLL